MAGDASLAAEFAAAYDDAARVALAAVGDLVDAFSTCGRLTAASLANHGRAENRSMISGRTVFDRRSLRAGYVAVLPCSLPSVPRRRPVRPARLGELDPRPGRGLRLAGRRHRSAARRRGLPGAPPASRSPTSRAYCDSAIRSFDQLRSPEVPIAVEVTERLAVRCRAVADQCAVAGPRLRRLRRPRRRAARRHPRPGPRPGPRRGGHPGHRHRARRVHRRRHRRRRRGAQRRPHRRRRSAAAPDHRHAADAGLDLRRSPAARGRRLARRTARARGLPPGPRHRRLGVRRRAAGPGRPAAGDRSQPPTVRPAGPARV